MINLELLRYNHDQRSTSGILSVNDEFECFTLEDGFNDIKVKGETRIPEGRYLLKLNTQLTPLTKNYRDRYHWFKWHIELQNVPGYQNVYIHIGNNKDHTEGCILVAQTATVDPANVASEQWHSKPAFQRLYSYLLKKLIEQETIFIDIRSIWK